MGVWVSGRSGGAPRTAGGRHPGPRPSPLGHPYTYPACLRFLLGSRGGGHGGGREGGGTPRAAASPAAFLVLHLPGGVDGGRPAFFDACALHNGKTAWAAGRGLDVASTGFEQLDFSADVDVVLGDGGSASVREGGGRGRAGRRGERGGGGAANRAVVIGTLRRVSIPSFAGPFGRALEATRGR